jgi:hypothetical protein
MSPREIHTLQSLYNQRRELGVSHEDAIALRDDPPKINQSCLDNYNALHRSQEFLANPDEVTTETPPIWHTFYALPGGATTNWIPGTKGFEMDLKLAEWILENRRMGFGRMKQMIDQIWQACEAEERSKYLPLNPASK